MVIAADVIRLHWEEKKTATQEATLEVRHANGDCQLFVIQILRMTDRMPPDDRTTTRRADAG
jgi:hypothetical protein